MENTLKSTLLQNKYLKVWYLMGSSKVKQPRHAQQAYTFCCISTIMRVKFINELITVRSFMTLLVTVVCFVSCGAPLELWQRDGLKSYSVLRITLLISVLAFCQFLNKENVGYAVLAFGWFWIMYGEILIFYYILFCSTSGEGGQYSKRFLLYYLI